MKIMVLGTRGEIMPSAPYHSRHSGVLLDDTLLLDCGQKEFLSYNPRAILITHLHPDHAFFVRSRDYEQFTIPMYAPDYFEGLPITVATAPFTIADYLVTPIPTMHSIKVKSTAYRIEHEGKSLLYTGDMIWIQKEYHHLLQGLDIVITEASHMRTGGFIHKEPGTGALYGHTGVPDLVRLFKRYTDTILLVHFGSWFYKDSKAARKAFQQLARENGIDIIVGYDGLTLTV